jgi:hypothetical protein
MFRWQTIVGVIIGLVAGGGILALTNGPGRGPVPSGPILSECDGHLRELVLHYEPSAKGITAPVYRDFLGALDGDVGVYIVCPDRAAFDDFLAMAGQVKCRVSPILAGHPITTWSRERWVALMPAAPGGATTLWSPRGEAGDEIWPARAGDERVGQDIAAALAPTVMARRSGLFFDGGDFLADGDTVFVVPRVLQRNIQHTAASREEFLGNLSRELKRRVILLDEAPDHHAGMFMASVGNRTMLVGDPSLSREMVSAEMARANQAGTNEFLGLPGGPDFTPQTQHLFDAVATQCAAAAYRVIRIPVVPARDGRTYLTYVNVLMDQQGSRRVVYLPFYRGAEPLNADARRVWESLGYEIRPVDCTSAYRHFGCLHCLVNVLQRSLHSPTLDARTAFRLPIGGARPATTQGWSLPVAPGLREAFGVRAACCRFGRRSYPKAAASCAHSKRCRAIRSLGVCRIPAANRVRQRTARLRFRWLGAA